MIRSKKKIEACFRARQGLPLPARYLTTLIIESIIARLLATQAVVVCGYVWMANHVHMQLYSLDGMSLINFQGQLKKRLTDFLKRLLNLPYLRLWEDRTSLGEVLDLEAAIQNIIYAFLNPVRAGLATSIDTYTGCNTWKEFISVPPDVNASVVREVPWIKLPDVQPLSSANPSVEEEHRVIRFLKEVAKSRQTHTITIQPFRWLQAFGISDPHEIERIRQRIISEVRAEEARLASPAKASQRLEGFVVTDEYRPAKKERTIFMYGSTKEIRLAHLAVYRGFIATFRRCYERMKQGFRDIDWPPECFIPPSPRLSNAF